jgi:hypothetical protein
MEILQLLTEAHLMKVFEVRTVSPLDAVLTPSLYRAALGLRGPGLVLQERRRGLLGVNGIQATCGAILTRRSADFEYRD